MLGALHAVLLVVWSWRQRFIETFGKAKSSPAQSRIIFAQIDLDESNHIWNWLPVSSDLLAQTTARFRSIKPTTYLRAADALHLACASMHGFAEIFSNDRHLLKASAAFKIKGCNVIV